MPVVNYLRNPLNDNIVREFDDAGIVVADYTTEGAQFGNVVSQRRNGQDSVYHYDGQGSTLALTDANGNVTDTYAYSAFGEVTKNTGSTANPFQYIGQKEYYWDKETGVHDVRRRQIETTLGRWWSPDPLEGDANGYIYVQNHPTLPIDASGESVIIICAVVVGGVGQYGICRYHIKTWDELYGARDYTPTEKKCINTAVSYMPWTVKNGVATCVTHHLSMGDNVGKPQTGCKRLCFLPPYNYGAKTYLGEADVNCTTCSSTLNLIMTLIHECWHQRLSCPGEVETYTTAIALFRSVKSNCAKMVKDGICKSVAECREEMDRIIAVDTGDLERERQAELE